MQGEGTGLGIEQGDAGEGSAIGLDGGEGLAIDPATVGSEMADGGAAHRDQGVAVGSST